MVFQELNELPPAIKWPALILFGAGGAKLLGVWLENRRLEKKDYRETLLGRIRELETVIAGMQNEHTQLRVEMALARDENEELRTALMAKKDRDEKPPQPV